MFLLVHCKILFIGHFAFNFTPWQNFMCTPTLKNSNTIENCIMANKIKIKSYCDIELFNSLNKFIVILSHIQMGPQEMVGPYVIH